MKKILALVVAMMVIIASMSAMAASTASIKITHDAKYDPGEGSTARTYSAYKVFDASYKSLSGANTQAAIDTFTYEPADAAVSYSMAADSPWLSVMRAAGQTWFDVKATADGNYSIVPKEGAYTTAEHAKAFAEYLAANIPDDATATTVTVDGTAATVNPGYYLIVCTDDDSDAVTRVAMVTTDVTMVEKNTYMKTSKDTEETNLSVGQEFEYTVKVSIPSNAALTVTEGSGYKPGHGPVILHDKMDSELDFLGEDNVSATIDSAAFTGFEVDEEPTDSDTFDIVIPVTEDIRGKTIEIKYKARVNETAKGDDGFINHLFGEQNGYKTVPDEPVVWTFDFNLDKTFEGVTSDKVDDYKATFEVQDKDGTVLKFKEDSTGYVLAANQSDSNAVAVVTVKGGDAINIRGLAAGTYTLVEKSTSTGFNLLDQPVSVVIEDTTTDPSKPSHKVNGNISSSVEVVNKSGTVLPSTGGIGTTIFYAGGSILVLAAVVLLVTKRRMSAGE